ncbi:MAG: EAL domain-containing protein [Acidobacteria bacterium]|nr:MAG: EAL domain-containing protein [Acidobacteriota bacterium]
MSAPSPVAMPALLLEDGLRLRGILVATLRAHGHAVTVCEDAATAWEAYQAARQPLLLLGGGPQRTDRGDLIRRIRALPGGDACVVVVVARDRAGGSAELPEGADDVLLWPLKPGALDLRLAAAERLARERAGREAGAAERLRLAERVATLEAAANAAERPPSRPAAGEPGPAGWLRRLVGRPARVPAAGAGPAEAATAPLAPATAAGPEAAAPPAPEPGAVAPAGAVGPEGSANAPAAAPGAWWEWDLKSGEIRFAPEWKDQFGYRPKDIGVSPDEWFRRVHPEDLANLKAAVGALLEGRSAVVEDRHRIQRSDGSWAHTVCRAVAVRDAGGAAIRVTGTHTDVTETRGLDPLTGLLSRASLMERIALALRPARGPERRTSAVLFLDLDRFKNINYSLGHRVGDQMLRLVAERLRRCLPAGEGPDAGRATAAHVGGDEFAVFLEGIADVNEAVRAAKRIQDELLAPFDVEGNEVFTSTSIGIAVGNGDYTRPEDLLRDADTAMFRAKALGKGSYVVFDAGMHARAVSLLKLETDLRRAIQREEFRVHYQPIVELDTGRISGFEALVRWQHPDGELLLPGAFLPVAEETGLIISIDRSVLREVCKQLRSWNAQFRRSPLLTVAVNVSGVQFMRPDMIVEVDRTLRNYGVYGRSLKLEITESVIMEHARYAADMLAQLKALDVKLSIDDFGTGYSSLSYLRRFEIDTLKVDSSFVARMDSDEDSWEIIRTIVTLGNNLGKDVVAEGIERGRQRELLLALRCRYGQGFFFSRAVDGEAATALLAADARGETLLKG